MSEAEGAGFRRPEPSGRQSMSTPVSERLGFADLVDKVAADAPRRDTERLLFDDLRPELRARKIGAIRLPDGGRERRTSAVGFGAVEERPELVRSEAVLGRSCPRILSPLLASHARARLRAACRECDPLHLLARQRPSCLGADELDGALLDLGAAL